LFSGDEQHYFKYFSCACSKPCTPSVLMFLTLPVRQSEHTFFDGIPLRVLSDRPAETWIREAWHPQQVNHGQQRCLFNTMSGNRSCWITLSLLYRLILYFGQENSLTLSDMSFFFFAKKHPVNLLPLFF
jgi:hypothetical protein